MVFFGPSYLPGVAVGNPVVGAEIVEEISDDTLRPGGLGEEDGAVLVVEHPQIPCAAETWRFGMN
jgi:hypothetical protein